MATEVGIDAGKRRRLPSWMHGISAADQGCKLRNDDEENVSSEVAKPKRKSRVKRLENEAQLCDKELTEVDSSLAVKCAKRSGKTKLSQRDVDSDSATHIEDEVVKKKMKRTCRTQREAEERAPEKKPRGKDYRPERSTDTMVPSPSEDDGELTMEDLISIAEEYVRADNETNHQPSGIEDSTSVTHPLPANFSSIESESGGSLTDAQSIGESSTHPTEISISNLSNTGSKDQDSTSQSIVAERSITGDPTQDMLDLFLGPLLKKSQKGEKTKEITTEEILDYEFMKHGQSQSVETEVVPLVKKKKSSLKDKVSMFLD